jgi:hypothetical protein
MYYIEVNTTRGNGLLQPMAKTLSAAKARYFSQMKKEPFGLTINDVQEIVVFKGRKIYGFYDGQFKRKQNVPVEIHNILYGLS